MNNQEAEQSLRVVLDEYGAKPYAALAAHIACGPDVREVTGPSGARYQIEVECMWDDQPGGDICVIGSIDDGGLRAFVPLTRSFIKASDERFLGE